jgi:hypothetical protein
MFAAARTRLVRRRCVYFPGDVVPRLGWRCPDRAGCTEPLAGWLRVVVAERAGVYHCGSRP